MGWRLDTKDYEPRCHLPELSWATSAVAIGSILPPVVYWQAQCLHSSRFTRLLEASIEPPGRATAAPIWERYATARTIVVAENCILMILGSRGRQLNSWRRVAFMEAGVWSEWICEVTILQSRVVFLNISFCSHNDTAVKTYFQVLAELLEPARSKSRGTKVACVIQPDLIWCYLRFPRCCYAVFNAHAWKCWEVFVKI